MPGWKCQPWGSIRNLTWHCPNTVIRSAVCSYSCLWLFEACWGLLMARWLVSCADSPEFLPAFGVSCTESRCEYWEYFLSFQPVCVHKDLWATVWLSQLCFNIERPLLGGQALRLISKCSLKALWWTWLWGLSGYPSFCIACSPWVLRGDFLTKVTAISPPQLKLNWMFVVVPLLS